MKTVSDPRRAHPRSGALTRTFLAHVDAPDFPCVGSKAALARDAIETLELGRLGDRSNDAGLLDALAAFGAGLDAGDGDDSTVRSFVALFEGPVDTSEQRFEALLWSQLQRLHELDAGRGAAGRRTSVPIRPTRASA